MTKVYVLTGSTSGIGRALLNVISKECIVFAGYRNPAHKEMLLSISDNIIPFFIDYSKPETIKDAAKYILENTDKIDTLINVAGCVVAGPVENLEIEAVKHQFDVNVFGHLELTQRLIPKMEGGKIINISSMASYGIFPFIAPYCASKRCLDIFFNSLFIENKKGIKVVSIKPGVIATPLWGKSIDENSKYFDKYDEYAEEMKYVIANAQRNEEKGLPVDRVVKTILKADCSKNPKPSYTVGNDALLASILSKLPQSWINSMVRLGIKLRID